MTRPREPRNFDDFLYHMMTSGQLPLATTTAPRSNVKTDTVQRTARISEDEKYRYELSRVWNRSAPTQVWVMLNPSTADAELDDPTIRRCIGFSKRAGYGGITVLNLYALRATSPRDLLGHPDPEGPENISAWREVFEKMDIPTAVAAWGVPPKLRSSQALSISAPIRWKCLGTTKDGHPRHPLYVRGGQPFTSVMLEED